MSLPGKKICYCSETGLTCQCVASGGICGIFWSCTDDTTFTTRPHRIRILQDGVTVVDTDELTGFYPLPEDTNAVFKIQMCCTTPCNWYTLWTGTLDNTGEEHCSLTVAGGIYEINASTSSEVPVFDCDAYLVVAVAARREDTVSPLVAEMYADSNLVFAGAVNQAGCIPDGALSECSSGPVADLSCSPPQVDFTGTYYAIVSYPVPMLKGSVLVHAINQAGDVQACTLPIPCYWHYDTIRVEIPDWNGQTLSCNGGDPKPIGFDASLGNRWRQTWSTEMELTGDLGGSYLFYSCSLTYPLIISTGTFSYTYEETGRIAYHTAAAPLVRLEAAYTRRYTYTGIVRYILDPVGVFDPGDPLVVAWGPGYTKFTSFSTDPTYFPVYLRIQVIFVDNEVDYDVDLSHEHDGSWEDPYPIVTTGTQTDAYFVNTLMAVVDVERDIDCEVSTDPNTDITWEWKTPFDYSIVYDTATDPPSSTGDFPLPPIGGVNGGAIGTPGDNCSCINEGSQVTNTEVLVLSHTVASSLSP